jgi:hypothetical protein
VKVEYLPEKLKQFIKIGYLTKFYFTFSCTAKIQTFLNIKSSNYQFAFMENPANDIDRGKILLDILQINCCIYR